MSIRTDDENPRPKLCSEEPRPIQWPVHRYVRCPPIIALPPQDFSSVLESRRSSRELRPAPLRELVNFVAITNRPRFVLEDDRYGRTRRWSPSAGALHPIDTLLVDWRGSTRLMRYDATEHRIGLLTIYDRDAIDRFSRDCAAILPEVRGTALVLAGNLSHVAAVYDSPISLLWRDAGVLLQTLSLVATALRLGFCPLGILGADVVRALFPREPEIVAVGVGLVGRSPA